MIDPPLIDPALINMDTVLIAIDDETTTITIISAGITGDTNTDTTPFVLPCGAVSLGTRHIHSDPPLPQDLTNAIGEMLDHIEDAKRELPLLLDATTIVVTGRVPAAIAAIEVGGPLPTAEFALTRDAAEDVFRTVATENHADRRHNPGLPPEFVDVIVGGCCVVVGLLRGLQLDGVTIRAGGTAP